MQNSASPREFRPGNRAWEDDEFECLQDSPHDGQRLDCDVLTLEKVTWPVDPRSRGLDTAAVERITKRMPHVKGKGGKERKTISLTEASKEALLNAKARVKRGAKLFVPEGRTTHG